MVARKKVLAGGPARNAKRIVLAGGCFDILHYGHIHFLKEAKKNGDFLIIALESDKTTKRLKGNTRPIHTQIQRRKILMSLNYVDKVISLPEMKSDEDYKKMVARIKPSVIAITQGDLMKNKKKKYAKLINAKLIEIRKIKTPSTTQIAKLIDLE